MKKPETLHLLPVRAESAAPALLRGKKLDQRAVFQLVRKVDWKKAGLIAGGHSRRVCRGRYGEPVQVLSGHRRA